MTHIIPKRLLTVTFLAVSMLIGFSSCDGGLNGNKPSGGGSSYSGYAPTLSGMTGKWLDIHKLMLFRYNGSSWDIAPGSYLEDKNFKVSGGSVGYTRIDDYNAYFEWDINYSYVYSGKTVNAHFYGEIYMKFTSSIGGEYYGYINGSPYDDQRFALTY